LAYAVERVPELHKIVRSESLNTAEVEKSGSVKVRIASKGSGDEDDNIQQPALFDFTVGKRLIYREVEIGISNIRLAKGLPTGTRLRRSTKQRN
jgi:hypothetical protein